MKPRKNKYYQCTHCGYIVHEKEARCRCHKCNGAVLPYKDLLGIGVPKLVDGKVFLK